MHTKFRGSFLRLLLFYVAITTGIWGASATAVYLFIDCSFNPQQPSRLLASNQSALSGSETAKPLSSGGFKQDLQPGQPQGVDTPTHPDSIQNTILLESLVRSSDPHPSTEVLLVKLRLGLGLGGVLVGVLSILSVLSVNYLVFEPTKRNFSQRIQSLTSIASHELRNSLTAVSTSAEMLASRPQQASSSEMKKLSTIISATNQLTRSVENLLFLVRTETTPANAAIDRNLSIPIDEVLEDVVERFELEAQDRSITFNLNLSTGVIVQGNSHQLLRLFSNLLENILSQAEPQRCVILSLKRCGRFAVIRMSNTGVDDAECPRRSVNEAQSRSIEKLGLDLVIAQTIAQCHGGTITVSNKTKAGNDFQVQLPVI
ncbi:MAG: HAMP domain-containing histidine kinase [Cyanobacteria bacterium CRU_2_1]|nr:HAMP domain-containing histidine kinase [Cyanobacteria bacterium CRU_2_1]